MQAGLGLHQVLIDSSLEILKGRVRPILEVENSSAIPRHNGSGVLDMMVKTALQMPVSRMEAHFYNAKRLFPVSVVKYKCRGNGGKCFL